MNRQHIFFRNLGGTQIKQDKTYLYNCMILEIATNWNFVQELMNKYKDEELEQVDQLEKGWFDFILQNNIDIEKLEDPDKFIENYFKIK